MINANYIKKLKSVKSVIGNLPEAWIEIYNDSRQFKGPGAFLAFSGAKYNAVLHLEDLIKRDCKLIVYEVSEVNSAEVLKLHKLYPTVCFVESYDLVNFCQELSHLQILDWQKEKNHFVLGISGSNGKTTHKEMMASMLEDVMPAEATWTLKNNNNHLGVPLTIFQMKPSTKIIVVELGSNHPGEIKTLCDICHPNCGVVTNIGATHLEFFGTEEEVFKEEGYLFWSIAENTKKEGLFLLNNDDLYLSTLPKTKGTFSVSQKSGDYFYKIDLAKSEGEIIRTGEEWGVLKNENIIGVHNFVNLLDSYLLLSKIFPEKRELFLQSAQRFVPKGMRSQWVDFKNKKIFLDAYNANPTSMKVALEGFKDTLIARGVNLDSCLVVLGEMKELGEGAKEMHIGVGEYASKLGFRHAAFVGQLNAEYASKFTGSPTFFGTAEDFKRNFSDWGKFEYLFIKGSRSLQLESILDITYH